MGGKLMDTEFDFENVEACRELFVALEVEARELEEKIVAVSEAQ